MRHAAVCAALSCLGAALVLAAPAPAMCDAMLRIADLVQPVCWQRLPPPCAMQCGVPPLTACLEQPPSSHSRLPRVSGLTPPPKPQPLRRAIHSHHPPLSALNDPIVHTGHTTVAVREQVRRWVQHVSSRWSTALGRGTYGGCVVGQDGQGLLRTLHRQVRRLLARRAASPNPDGRFDTPHSTPLHGVHSTTEGHLGGTCCSGWVCSEGCERESCPPL
jgi:hypothetical protein